MNLMLSLELPIESYRNEKLARKLCVLSLTVFIPNRTFLVRFGGISGEFGRAMIRILARRSRAKIPMARPSERDMPRSVPKRYD